MQIDFYINFWQADHRSTVMLPLMILIALLTGCHSTKNIDESHYTEGSVSELIQKSTNFIDSVNNKEALLQLYALGQYSLTVSQDRWVRDAIIKIYHHDRDYSNLITYLNMRSLHSNISADEQAFNLFDKAEAYHCMSYNYWARKLGLGSPYRKSRDAVKAQQYYEEFLIKYPHHEKADYVRHELQMVADYNKQYIQELQKHQVARLNVKK